MTRQSTHQYRYNSAQQAIDSGTHCWSPLSLLLICMAIRWSLWGWTIRTLGPSCWIRSVWRDFWEGPVGLSSSWGMGSLSTKLGICWLLGLNLDTFGWICLLSTSRGAETRGYLLSMTCATATASENSPISAKSPSNPPKTNSSEPSIRR